jgi:pimeloyl-ACP methyl ester carboxylesterase
MAQKRIRDLGKDFLQRCSARMNQFSPKFRSTGLGALGLAASLLLAGCGSTIITHIASHPVRPIPQGILSRVEIREDARKATQQVSVEIAAASPEELVRWAGTNPNRLTQAAEIVLQRAELRQTIKSGARAGYALAACELGWQSLIASGVPSPRWLTDPSTKKSTAIYNTALAMFISEHGKALAGGLETLEIVTPLGPVTVIPRYASGMRFPAGYFDDVIPADNIRATGFTTRARVPGLGTPLVGVRDRTPARSDEMKFQPPGRGVYVPLAALAQFSRSKSQSKSTRLSLKLYDLDNSATARLQDHAVPLAGDFTAPMALSFDDINDLMIGIKVLLDAEAGKDYYGIYLTEPFDPNRIPVLLLHGLSSSPLVWRNIVTKAQLDPVIRKNYQFWFAFYSSGEPVLQTTALLRNRLAAIRQAGDPKGTSLASKETIIVGYSMGGILARLLATDIGTQYWAAFSSRSFDEMPLEPKDRQTVEELIFWKPDNTIKQLIFLATPHKGTRMADASFAQLGRKLVGLPGNLLKFQKRIFTVLGDFIGDPTLNSRLITGIDSLSPKAVVYKAFTKAPIVSGATTHSIIGDQGKGDTPESSDGVVGYWSSHLDSAESEIIVPTGHDVQTDPHSEAEIQRILLDNLNSGRR